MPYSLYRDSDRPVRITIRYRCATVSTQKVCGTFWGMINTGGIIWTSLIWYMHASKTLQRNAICTTHMVRSECTIRCIHTEISAGRVGSRFFCKFRRDVSVWVKNMLEIHFCLLENLCAYSNPNLCMLEHYCLAYIHSFANWQTAKH